jgi:nucleotide-binding universal stress UspA family protein
MTTDQERRIVVGVDGSPSSQAALRWAIGQAKVTGASVQAVTAWHYPAAYGWEDVGLVGDFQGTAQQVLSQALSAASGIAPGVSMDPLVLEGYAADVLLRTAGGADLLVVGSRGHGGLTSALLGSVSLHCVLHAPCPVLVLRQEEEVEVSS